MKSHVWSWLDSRGPLRVLISLGSLDFECSSREKVLNKLK